MNWFILGLKKYAVFEGRARRTEFWMFCLFYIIFSIVATLLDYVTGTYNSDTGMGILSAVFSLLMIIPSISVSVRRLHDTDRSGWWYLLVFLPLIGAIVLLIFFVLDSTPGENRFGPNPKQM